MELELLEQEALRLPAAARAKLAFELLESLDTLTESEAEEMWLDEAQRRLAELEAGLVQAVPAEEVDRKARALLR